MFRLKPGPAPTRWDLDAEAVAVKIRWFGLVVGYLYANFGPAADPTPLNVILALGFAFTALDTYLSWRGRVVLGAFPLVVSCMEALFIGLLCYTDGGLESPFRYYYILSLVCAGIRYSPAVTGVTFGLDCLSYVVLFLTLPADRRGGASLVLGLIVLGWVTWAAVALARLLRRVGDQLSGLNHQLRENQALLEERMAERTRELQESQAQVLHQEKMAAFGLLAAGIAHEVGNPLTSISTLVQMLERRDPDDYTRERLGLVTTQLTRIQAILRELVTFSRPASDTRVRVCLKTIIDEALGIAKYYKGVKGREVRADIPAGLPPLVGVRDQLVQVFFNLVLNAIDATGKGGKVVISARATGGTLVATVADDGHGIDPKHRERLFRPYFTTKRHGTGLGLFVTQKLVHAHGGTVGCESHPGEGTTFRLVFPLAPPPAAPADLTGGSLSHAT
ncbi:MAG: zraS 2 [Gemmataceae bacterium]|nr:zraS 2 [Gemmataceae bacterium]